MSRQLSIEALGQPISTEAAEFADSLLACAAVHRHNSLLDREYRRLIRAGKDNAAIIAQFDEILPKYLNTRDRVHETLDRYNGQIAIIGFTEHISSSTKPAALEQFDEGVYFITGRRTSILFRMGRICLRTLDGAANIKFAGFKENPDKLQRPQVSPAVLFGLPTGDGETFAWNSHRLAVPPDITVPVSPLAA